MDKRIQRIHYSHIIGTCSWSEWWETDCSVTCGRGTLTRTRYNRVPRSIEEGGNCKNLTETQERMCDTKILCIKLGKYFIHFLV